MRKPKTYKLTYAIIASIFIILTSLFISILVFTARDITPTVQIDPPTTGPPTIQSTNIKGGATIPMVAELFAELSSAPADQHNLAIHSEPEQAWHTTFDGDRTYHFSTPDPLPAATDLQVTIFDSIGQVEMLTAGLKVARQPAVISGINPTGITPDDKLSITFAEPMDTATADLIIFSTTGSGHWENDTTYTFEPQQLAVDTTYTYTLKKDLATRAGGLLLEDAEYAFTTRGAVTVVDRGPFGSGRSRDKQTIYFTFAYPVDHASAERAFGISSGNISGFSWSGNTMRVTVTGFGWQQEVSAWVSSGVLPSGFGLTSNTRYMVNFTTEARTTRLNIPFYYQTFPQSCEESALRSGLAYRGIYTDDWSILERVGYNPRPKDEADNWDNPNYMFVGDANGKQADGTGYGAFWGPIASAGRSFGANTVAQNMSVGAIADAVHAGNPIIVWTLMPGATWRTWHTPQGDVSVPLPIHVKIVYGVAGESWAPQTFYVWDPIYGKLTYTAHTLAGILFGSAVVVY